MGIETVRLAITLPLLRTGSLLCRSLWSSRKRKPRKECGKALGTMRVLWARQIVTEKESQSNAQGYSIFVRLVLRFLKCALLILQIAWVQKNQTLVFQCDKNFGKHYPLRMLSKIINIKTQLFLNLSFSGNFFLLKCHLHPLLKFILSCKTQLLCYNLLCDASLIYHPTPSLLHQTELITSFSFTQYVTSPSTEYYLTLLCILVSCRSVFCGPWKTSFYLSPPTPKP